MENELAKERLFSMVDKFFDIHNKRSLSDKTELDRQTEELIHQMYRYLNCTKWNDLSFEYFMRKCDELEEYEYG
jgi:hypothetical protein